MKNLKLSECISIFINVKELSETEDVATYVFNNKNFSKEYTELAVTINYPFNGASFVIPKAKSIYDIAKPIADFYKNSVYNDPEKNGVWGHSIDDLYLEQIIIYDNNNVEVSIGS